MSRRLTQRWRRPAPAALKLPAALTRQCPKCGAELGQSCRRPVGGRVKGEDIGGGDRWVTMTTVHAERRHNPASAEPGTALLAAPVDPRATVVWSNQARRAEGTKMHVIGGCCRATLDTTRSVPAAEVPSEQRCGRPGCRNRWPEVVAA